MPTRPTRPNLRAFGMPVALALMLSGLGCAYWRKPDGPIPVKLIPAPQSATVHPLVIVLPGRGDDLDDLTKTGMAEAIQKAWPEADVLLAGATLPYYTEGHVQQRIHDEVVAPARARGYQEIWLTGASMGGMGTLLYEHSYPHDVTGIVLYAPYMGEADVVKQVADAGGPARWDPGPTPVSLDAENYQREMWRVVKSWQDTAEARRVWLVCGDSDRLLEEAKLMAPLLPRVHFIEVKGGHDWPMWDAGAAVVFPRIAAGEAH
jgi:pimeloyl-ACP methyl ester carboxylesterase